MQTAAVVNYLVTRSDLKDDPVYQMTKAIFDNLPELAAAHSAGKDIKLEDALAGHAGPAASRRRALLQGKGRC